MAGSTQAAVRTERVRTRRAAALERWHLLSFDAPTVAVVWTWFVARGSGVDLPVASLVAMGLAVWMLYAADRLLDARLLDARLLDARLLDARLLDARLPHLRLLDARGPDLRRAVAVPELEERHVFHFEYRARFLVGICGAAVGLAAVLPRLSHAAIGLYLAEASLLFAWFLILHATGSAHRLPKEIAVGLFFAAATFVPTVARRPEMRLELLVPAGLFAALCSLNCLYIYRWEHALEQDDAACHPSTRMALRHLGGISLTLAVAGGVAAAVSLVRGTGGWPVPAACALATVLLVALDRGRRRLGATTLRAAADLVLLTPLLWPAAAVALLFEARMR